MDEISPNNTEFGRTSRYRISVSATSFSLSILAILAFTLHLFIYAISSTAYLALAVISTVVYIVSKKIFIFRGKLGMYNLLWGLAIVVLLANYLLVYQSNTVLVDNIILICGLLIIIFFSTNARDYERALALIKCLSMFFALGVLLQILIPPVYRLILNVLPSGFSGVVSSGEGETGALAYRGFTTNTGFAVNYILIGFFAVISGWTDRTKKRHMPILLLFAFAIVMTGKRSPLLFTVITITLCYLITSGSSEKTRRFRRVFFVLFAIIILYVSLQDVLADIPGVGRIVNGIRGFFAGEDVSHGRSRLYAWAIQLFLNSPVFGIGWGKYRTTVAGVATLNKTLEVHNVYLQLLCETGIVGFMCFVSVFLVSWVMTKNSYFQCVRQTDSALLRWRPLLFFSFVFQTYFILYCLTGNPLYDQFYQIMYTFACSIMLGYRYWTSKSAFMHD